VTLVIGFEAYYQFNPLVIVLELGLVIRRLITGLIFSSEIQEVEGVIWRRQRYPPWVCRCQKCGYKWNPRPRPWNTPLKTPQRCPKCHTRNWMQKYGSQMIINGFLEGQL